MAGPPPLSGSEGKPVQTGASSPTGGELGLNKGLPTTPSPLAGGDATFNEYAAAHELALNTTLAGDQNTLNNLNGVYEYNHALLTAKENPNSESNTFARLRSREIGEGIAQSGMAAGNHERQLGAFQNKRNTEVTKALNSANATKLKAKGEVEGYNLGMGQHLTASNRRKEAAAIGHPQVSPEAPPSPGAPPYPGATAAVAQAFPGGEAEHIAYVKAAAKGEGPAFLQAMREGRPWVSGNYAQRAKGGPVQAGHPYLVGERGPELMVPKSSGRVIRNAAIKKAMRSGRH